jgi:predicted peptidase
VRRILITTLQVLLFITATLVLAVAYFATRDYTDRFRERHGEFRSVQTDSSETDTLVNRSWVTLTSSSGLRVACGVLVPLQAAGTKTQKYPAIVLLGGKATGRNAVRYAFDIGDVVIVAPDYAYEPRHSYSIFQFLGDLPEIHETVLDMIPSVMLTLDYLERRGDVDMSRVVMMGYSFGAPFVPVIMSNEARPAVAAIVYGGGDMESLIRHNVARYESPFVADLVGKVSGVLTRPLEPLDHVGAISPRPVLMINGLDDEQVPRANAEMLYERAGQPKKIIWLESKHVNPRNVALTVKIIRTLREELVRMGIMKSGLPPMPR